MKKKQQREENMSTPIIVSNSQSFIDSASFVSNIDTDECAVCGITKNLLRCARCKTVKYCTKKHQITDWRNHKKNCFSNVFDIENKNSIDTKTELSGLCVNYSKKRQNENNCTGVSKNNEITFNPIGSIDIDATCVQSDDSLIKENIVKQSAGTKIRHQRSSSKFDNSTNPVIAKKKSNTDRRIASTKYPEVCTLPISYEATKRHNTTSEARVESLNSTLEDLKIVGEREYVVASDIPRTLGLQNVMNFSEVSLLSDVEDYSRQFVHTNLGISGEMKLNERCRELIRDMNEYGVCIFDDFLGPDLGMAILNEVRNIHSAGMFKDGQLVSNKAGDDGLKRVRSDQTTWVDGKQKECRNIGKLVSKVDEIIARARRIPNNGEMANYTIHGRTEAMVACYPGSGSHFVKHVDNPNHDGRCITAIYYLNKNWDVEKNGGLLRIFPEGWRQDMVANIEPLFDRLLFFWSDRRNPHEVQPAYETRYAITLWYLDTEKRDETCGIRPKEREVRSESLLERAVAEAEL